MKHIKDVFILIVIALIGTGLLFLLSPDDMTGSFGDAALKIFNLGVKAAMFTLGLKVFFGFLKFDEIFENAKKDPGMLAIAVSLIIVAWALVISPY